jgi:hypothetical protein
MIRATVLRTATILLLAAIAPVAAQTPKKAAPATDGTVWVSPSCGCCSKWVDYMIAAGFTLKKEVTADLQSVPARKRVPEAMRSCHTAQIGQYLVEGHIPADVVRKLLKEKPQVVGIAAPGMPMGSPGMEGPNAQPYTVIAFRADGSTYDFARVTPQSSAQH